MGAATRVELEGLLSQLPPPALLGVGNRALEPALRSMVHLEDVPVALRVVPGALGQPDCELRALLVEGLRLCAGATAGPSLAGSRR